METTIVFFVIVFLIFVSVFGYLEWQDNKKRQEAYHNWSQLYDWSYNPNRDRQIYDYYSNFNRLRKGFNRYGFDVLEGEWDGYRALSFNFHYTTSSGKTNSQHYLGVVMIMMERSFLTLVIRPKNFFEKIGNALGFKDIISESTEFSQSFAVRCSSIDFAEDFCHPRMMEYLLTIPDTVLELHGNTLVIFNYQGKMYPSKVEENLNKLTRIRQLMPKFLFRK